MKQNLFAWADDDETLPSPTSATFSNQVIRASAGTGKTFQLSNRYIALAEAAERPEDILAATFARKAAGEILDRVVLRLAEAATDPGKLAELAGFLKEQSGESNLDQTACLGLLDKLIQNLHRLRISTLDSFFVQIAGSFGLELGLPPGWSIVDEVADQRHRSLAIGNVLAEGSVSELLTLLHLLNKGDVTRAVSDQIRGTANSLYHLYRETTPDAPDAELPPAWRAIKRYKQLDEPEWAEALQALESLHFPDNKRFQSAIEKDVKNACDGDWDRLISCGFVKLLLEGKTTYYNKPVPDEVGAVYAPILEHLKSQLINRIADHTESTWKLLHKFHLAYERLKIEQRAYRFQDITQMLANAIRGMDAEQLAFRLDAGVQHLLLDEFQDTSLLQWAVIRPFAEAAGHDPDRSFFCVGDVKQAIYGWRGGVADLFSSLDQQIPNLEERELTRSFRSSQIVMDVVNQVFGRLDSNQVANRLEDVAEVWGQRFVEHTTALKLPGYCVLKTSALAGEEENQQIETLKFAAGEIARLHREAPGASIGILVRRNQAVARMIYELRQTHGIEASEEGGNPLMDSAAVQLILSLLAIADHPGNTIARYHVAKSPLGKLANLTDHADDQAAHKLSAELRRDLLSEGYGLTVSRFVRGLAGDCNERELARLQQLVSLAYRYEDQATGEAGDFLEMVSATKVEDPMAAQVRVMNIHQSKGLEFDIVVLPELDGRMTGLTPPIIVGRKSPTEPVEAVFRYIPANVLPLLPERFTRMLKQHQHQIDNESLCLLYVAMTRAVHALHLIVAPSKENERSLPKSHAGLLRSALAEGKLGIAPDAVLYEHGDWDWYKKSDLDNAAREEPEVAEPIRIVLREAGKRRRFERRSPSDLDAGTAIDLGKRFRDNSALSRTQGQLWHAWLERLDWLDAPAGGIPPEDTLRQIAGRFLHPRLDLDVEIARFREALTKPEIARALSRKQYDGWDAFQLEREYPIASLLRNVLTNGFIDRLVFLKRDGQIQGADILDFKLGGDAKKDDRALDLLGESYRPQLTAYREAIGNLFSLDEEAIQVRCVFLKAGRVWTLSESRAES